MSYDKDSIKVGLTDMYKLRRVPQMYGPLSDKGFVHAIKEVVQNSLDEASADEIMKSKRIITVDVSFEPDINLVVIEDNGRGIPPERILNVLTELHTSGKSSFNDDTSYEGATAGAHGVGIKFTNGVSKELAVSVYRDGQIYSMQFKEGEPVTDLITTKFPDNMDKKKTGTRIAFTPDKTILGEFGDVEDMLESMLEELAYITKKTVVINYTVLHKGQVKSKKSFSSENGLAKLMKKFSKEIGVKTSIPFKQFDFEGDKDTSYRVLFGYSKDISGYDILSFCNNCSTVSGGYHVDGFVDTFCKLAKEYVTNNLSEKEKKNLNVTLNDAREGLVAIIVCTHPRPLLEGQIKDKVLQKEFIQISKDLIEKEWENLVHSDKSYMKSLFDFIRNTVLVKNKAKEMKSSYLKEKDDESTFLGTNGKLVAANGDSSIPKELFLVEGDSAMGSASYCRDTKSQAIFPVRGKIKNTIEDTLAKVLENEELRTLVKVLGTNIGPKFDIKKLNYDKIIIMTDADVDGMAISSLICTFFTIHMPEIVTGGYLYRAVPPLYSFIPKNSKKEVYLTTYYEYVSYIEQAISEYYTISKNSKDYTSDGVKELLIMNKDYKDEIDKIAIRLSLTPDMVEDAVLLSDMTTKEKEEFLKRKHPYLKLDKNNDGVEFIEGISDNQYQYVEFGENFFTYFHKAIELISLNNYSLDFKVNGKDYTLYNMLKLFEEFKPNDIKRYKGLAEMNPVDLHRTTMNPENRILVRLTANDISASLKRFKALHGKTARDIYERKKLMDDFKITKDDLDN